MVFEKKIQTLEERQADTLNNLSAQFDNLNESITQLKAIPNPSPEQKNALSVLSEAVGDINKIKGSLINLGIVSAIPGTASTQPSGLAELEAFRNPDGSLNTVALGFVKGADALKTFIEAKAKQTPEPGKFVETPAPPSVDEKYVALCTKPESARTPADTAFMCEYEDAAYHALKGMKNLSSAQLGFVQKYEAMLQKQNPPAGVVEPPAEALPATQPAIQPTEQPAEKVGVVDRLKSAEETTSKNLDGLV